MMPGVQYEEVWKALYTGYSKKSLDQMLRTRLDVSLDEIVADGPMKDMAFDLLGTAEREGWGVELIRQAYEFNPRNPELLKIYEKYGLAPGVSAQRAGSTDSVKTGVAGLEKTIKDRLPMFDFALWRERMAEIEVRVCRVEINGNAAGTGFLVGPDTVLTNYHVLEKVLKQPTSVACRFDYKVLADGSRIEGAVVGLHPEGVIDSSPYAPAENTGTPDAPPPTDDQLDYALIRLARRFGEEPSASKGSAGAPRRGWIVLPSTEPVLLRGDPLMIAQHPDGKPLKLAVDTESYMEMNANHTRIRYATNTESGSSGSPVFDMDWKPVALHHLGDPAYNHASEYNQGVPLNKIRERIARNHADVLGT